MLARRKARDLFDSRLIFSMDGLDFERLRIAFVVYGAMGRKDWRTVSVTDVEVDVAELVNQLVPSLHIGAIGGPEEAASVWKDPGRRVPPRAVSSVALQDHAERAFLDLLLEKGANRRDDSDLG